jgi:hypothetical protein
MEKTLQHYRFQFQKGTQRFVRMNDAAFAVTVFVDNPPPFIFDNSAAITPGPTGSAKHDHVSSECF